MSDLVLPIARPASRSHATLFRSVASCAQLAITVALLGVTLVPSAVLLQACFERAGALAVVVAIPLAYAVWGISFCLALALVKQCVLGRGAPGTYPYLSAVVLRWALVTQLSKVAQQMFLVWVMGTDVIVWWFRLLGARIGRRVTLNTVFVYDWDMLEIGDDAFIGGRSTLMAHVGQMGHVTFTPTRIGARCTIGQDTTVFPGVVMEDGAMLGANSLALEGQRLEADRVYLGVPARCVRKRPVEALPTVKAARAWSLMDRNESPYPPSPGCLAAIRRLEGDSLTRYAREDELTGRLAGWLGVQPDEIVVGAGAEGILKTAFSHLLQKGDTALLPAPSWWYYDHLASRAGAVACHYPLREDDSRFVCDIEEVLDRAKATRARMVVLASPNNPTGGSLSLDDVSALLERLEGTAVVLDEAYWGFSGTDNSHLPRLCADHPRLLVVRTFSKFFGLAGLRVGFAIGGAGLAGLKEAAAVYLGHDRIAEAVAIAALDEIDYYRSRAAEIQREKARFAKALAGATRVKVFESDTNFLLLRFVAGAAEAFREQTEAAGIKVKLFCEAPLEGCARISLGTAHQNHIVLECLEAVERRRASA